MSKGAKLGMKAEDAAATRLSGCVMLCRGLSIRSSDNSVQSFQRRDVIASSEK